MATSIPHCNDIDAIIPWVRRRWIEISGKVNTSVTDPERFLLKLRCGCHIDRGTFLAMRRTLHKHLATIDFGKGIDLHPVCGSVKGGAA